MWEQKYGLAHPHIPQLSPCFVALWSLLGVWNDYVCWLLPKPQIWVIHWLIMFLQAYCHIEPYCGYPVVYPIFKNRPRCAPKHWLKVWVHWFGYHWLCSAWYPFGLCQQMVHTPFISRAWWIPELTTSNSVVIQFQSRLFWLVRHWLFQKMLRVWVFLCKK